MAESIRVNLESPAMGDLINYLEGAIKGIDKFGNVIDEIQKPIESMNKGFTKTMSLWLNLMFLGQNLNKIFGGLRDLIWQTYINAAFLDLSFGMMAALQPILDPVIDLVYDLLDAFYDLPGPIQMVIAGFVLLIGIVVSVIPLLTNLVLMNWALAASGHSVTGALTGVTLGFAKIKLSILNLLPWMAALALAAVLFGFIWRNNLFGVADVLDDLSFMIDDTLFYLDAAVASLGEGDVPEAIENTRLALESLEPINIFAGLFTGEGDTLLAKLHNWWIDVSKDLATGFTEFMLGLEKSWGEFTAGLNSGFWETWGKVKVTIADWKKGWDEFTSGLGKGWDETMDKVQTKVDEIKTWMQDNILTPLGTAWDDLGTGIKGIWDDIESTIQGVYDTVKPLIDFITGAEGPKTPTNESPDILKGAKEWINSLDIPFIHLNDFIMRPGSSPISFNPSDTILGVKDLNTLRSSSNNYGGNQASFTSNITISVNSATSRSDLETLKRELNQSMEADFRRLTSGWK